MSEERSHSWRSIDLVAAATNPPEPPTIGGLLYRQKRALLSGERDALKTWLATILSKAEIDAGYAVAWADLDAMGSGDVLDRLRLLGVADEKIASSFLYYAPAERLADERLHDVAAELRERDVRLFVADAFNPFLNLHGLDPTKTADIETFWREVADPICAAGAAPLLLDHVPKNAANRGAYAYGSERKASGAIVHLGLRIVTPFGRGRIGASTVECHRDRQGYLPRPRIGLLELAASSEGIAYSLRPEVAGDEFRPTHLMERVSRYLEPKSESVSRNSIEQEVAGKATAKRLAVDQLVAEGFASETDGLRGAKMIASIRAYREEDDLARSSADLPSLTSSLARDEVGTRSVGQLESTSSLVPLRRWDEDEVESDLVHDDGTKSLIEPNAEEGDLF